MANLWLRVFPPETRRTPPFTETPGVSNMPPRDANPIQYFLLLFTVGLMKKIIRHTNRYARNFLRNHRGQLTRHSRAKAWKPLSITELKCFIAMQFNMSILRKSTVAQYWNSLLKSQASVWFKNSMSRNRFQNILKYIHVADYQRMVDREHPAYDPSARFRPLLSFINRQFSRFLTPHRELCVDETLVASKGHSIMLQYIPSKAAKYGIKFWVLCEAATGYILQMHVYRGRTYDPTPRGELQGAKVVLDLLQSASLLNKGYHVFCDSFFSSLQLASRLLEHRTFITGTLRKNRPMPMTIKNANPEPGTAVYMRKGSVLCMSHRDSPDKKPVRLLSTILPAQQLPSGKPRIVQGYNKNMGAVDTNDAIFHTYGGNRKCKKVWKKIMFHLFQRILLNSYILYCKNTSDSPVLSRLKFIQLVIESLSNTRSPDRRRRRPHCSIETLPGKKERDCCVCSNRSEGVRRRSRTICTICRLGVHRSCLHLHPACNEQ